jgi:hypothetical protein
MGADQVMVLSVIVAVIVSTTTIAMGIKGFSTVPVWDQWGALTGADIWRLVFQQHNEHRVVFPLLFFLADIKLANGTNVINTVAIYVILIVQALQIAWLAARSPSGIKNSAFIALCSIAVTFMLSSYQWENFLWGFQVAFVSVTLVATLAFTSITFVPGIRGVLLGAALGAAAAFSLANGILVPIVGLALAAFTGRRIRDIIVLGGLCALTLVAFFYGYHKGPHALAGPTELLRAVRYYLLYLGAPFGQAVGVLIPGGEMKNGFAVTAGGLGVVLALALAVHALLHRRDTTKEQWVLLHLLGFLSLTGAITAVGRSPLGLHQAFSSRYGTPVLLFWLVLFVFPIAKKSMLGRVYSHIKPGLIIGTLVVLVVIQGQGIKDGQGFFPARHDVRLALLSRVAHPALYKKVFPDPDFVTRQSALLERERLGPFSEPWAGWFGKQLSEAVTIINPDNCRGSFDRAAPVSGGASTFSIAGWAWDRISKTPPDGIVAVGSDGKVIGYASVTDARPDVRRAVAEVATRRVGWHGFLKSDPGNTITAYAVMNNMTVACPLSGPQTVSP